MSTQEVINSAAVHNAHNLQTAMIYELWHIREHTVVTCGPKSNTHRAPRRNGTVPGYTLKIKQLRPVVR